MNLEERRAELEQMVQDEFLGSPEAWYKGWKVLASLYEAGEVYATAMAGRFMARNQPPGTTPPEEVVVFQKSWEACRAIEHEESKHVYGLNGFCDSGYSCGARVAYTKYISEQNRMIYQARKRLRDEAEAQRRAVDRDRQKFFAPAPSKALD